MLIYTVYIYIYRGIGIAVYIYIYSYTYIALIPQHSSSSSFCRYLCDVLSIYIYIWSLLIACTEYCICILEYLACELHTSCRIYCTCGSVSSLETNASSTNQEGGWVGGKAMRGSPVFRLGVRMRKSVFTGVRRDRDGGWLVDAMWAWETICNEDVESWLDLTCSWQIKNEPGGSNMESASRDRLIDRGLGDRMCRYIWSTKIIKKDWEKQTSHTSNTDVPFTVAREGAHDDQATTWCQCSLVLFSTCLSCL